MTELQQDIFMLMPEIVLTIVGIMSLFLGAFLPRKSAGKLITALLILVVSSVLYTMINDVSEGANFAFNRFFAFNPNFVRAKLIILFFSVVVFLLYYGINFEEDDRLGNFEVPVIALFSIVGMMLMISSNDFTILYLGVELFSLAFYVLVAVERNKMQASESGIKYFILGSVASAILLYGISIIYGFTGTTNFSIISFTLNEVYDSGNSTTSLAILVGMILVLTGLFFKLGVAPFHMWVMDVYQGTNNLIVCFIASVPKIALVMVLMNFTYLVFGAWQAQWQQIIIFVAVLSMVVGALGAIMQNNLKRLIGYSSIAHMGYVLMAIGAASEDVISVVLLYLIIYSMIIIGIFATTLLLRSNKEFVDDIGQLSGLIKSHPVLAMILVGMFFSMAGIPPFAGFFGKFYILQLVINAEFYSLAVIAVLSSVISAFYYLRVIKQICMSDAGDVLVTSSFSIAIKAILLMTTLFNFLFYLLIA